METLKVKAIAAAVAVGTAVVPPALYHTARGYIQVYNYTESRVLDAGTTALSYIGLQRSKNDEAPDILIETHARKYNVNASLMKCLINRESNKNSDAYSPKGAIGLGQIMPANAKRCGYSKVSKLWDEDNNIRCSSQILSEELTTYKGNLKKALEAYNGGPRCVGSCTESVNYARSIIECFAQSSV